jgi:predicted nucleotidyltransferase
MTLTPAEVAEIVGRIVSRMRPDKVIVFGSYAKGTSTIESDLDILIVAETDLPTERRTEAIEPLLSRTLIPVDIHVYTNEELDEYIQSPYSFISTVVKSGKVMFDATATRE